MFKVLIADDHSLIRSAVKVLLQNQGYNVVAEATNGIDAVQLARQHVVDMVILDITMPGLDGLDVISRIKASGLNSRILVLTSQPPLFYSQRCMKAGAAGFISKTQDLSELLRAIKVVMDGYMFFPNLTITSVRNSDGTLSDLELIEQLSARELSILQQLARGLSNKKIAEDMTLSSKTISTYKTRLIEKLNIKSVVYLADFAKRNDLI
ncbi:two component transcriptional regulator, LuxR family [Pseudomonas taetrolens]|uniref:LuxR family transcriptional regulator n=1 Tax=Pseudomonas taetrolens TaxID=47884 RepID=A0A0J6GVI8_PSETA|nr:MULTISPECIES: response regulator transcription factor [Pseudomonas]KMM86323.1 LuxR family transcriptional regulator [Pseudomonas taetrolens]MBW0234972.1 LuxR family transcriptional regulator [Pseudomonas sp. D1HM]SEC86392.1 two component transcriptional regulator, LuxR family [Pseudomonas taetrolens]SQF87326.1 LuxR family DNA-binding response regulator [Pseudomonas taetrolens]VEH50518.1 LuxR family DNA-binding response regulator [Pseudomonas taetrolens]